MASKKVVIKQTHIDIKPPSIPSNIESIYVSYLKVDFILIFDVFTYKTMQESDFVFNKKGFYADLDRKLDDQKVNSVNDH